MKHGIRYAINTFLVIVFLTSPCTVAQAIEDSISDINSSRISSLQEGLEWWRSASDVEQKVEQLQGTPIAIIPIPVLFGVSLKDILPDFGTPRRNHLHEGQDIIALKGTPIISPTDAVVIHTDYGVGEGNAVYTSNPGGETFVYYHLDRIGEGVAAGSVLKKGDLIGYVGNTGSTGGTAHLHFEIRHSSGVPTDPFLRFGGEFSLQEKILFLSHIITQATNGESLLRFLVMNFPSTFAAAVSESIALPKPIEETPTVSQNVISPEPVTNTLVPSSTSTTSPIVKDEHKNDLSVGSLGLAVLALQNYLIEANFGNAAIDLKNHGATGYFGPLTKAALAEYQVKMGIASSLGYYDGVTRALIESHPLSTLPSPDPIVQAKASTPLILKRDLYQGIGGEDVRSLQKFLNTEGYTVSLTGNGSLGNEIPYFGPGTRAAVIKFQIAHNITPAVGRAGPMTRSIIASF